MKDTRKLQLEVSSGHFAVPVRNILSERIDLSECYRGIVDERG
jgi:hypothetical protein